MGKSWIEILYAKEQWQQAEKEKKKFDPLPSSKDIQDERKSFERMPIFTEIKQPSQ